MAAGFEGRKDFTVVKAGLLAFYRKVEETQNPAFLKALKKFKNWQVEILNSYVFGYSNGFLEEHFKAKILLSSI